ncbi:hypothetical protein WOLCODRAFT_147502 [Wolfiporia cocos MD-104 SS10]|uniref:Uncharacterized protein n=1 Tax=Wolfiporia cocos (strain MD-104) TaxID=742152 RepID=A0A2H3J0U2_WOLCO|nr:hypothetical protein WOLCODRAFT_147502 [Wolfiporia cocos MD-104 SS10]
MSPSNEKLKLFIATHRTHHASNLHYTLALAPMSENPSSAAKTTMWYQVLHDPMSGARYYQQTSITCMRASDTVARVLLGQVDPVHQRALEQLMADPRHLEASSSSHQWVRNVLKVISGSGVLRSSGVINADAAVGVLKDLSKEVQRGARASPQGGSPTTIVYPTHKYSFIPLP